MNFQDILNHSRSRLGDNVGPDNKRLWTDLELAGYASDAEQEITRRLYLLKDSDTIGYVRLDIGTVGQIDSVSVGGVVITSGTVVFDTSLTKTASNLAANINAYTSDPNYRAVARGVLVIIKAIPQSGDFPTSGYTVAVTASGGLTASATSLPGLCRHVLTVGQRYLPMNEKVIAIRRFKPGSQSKPLPEKTKDDMDAESPGWETYSNGTITKFIPEYDEAGGGEIIVSPPTNVAEVIEQECYRLPLADFSIDDLAALPEIGAEHHFTMIEWILRQAYRKNDVETLDLARSQTHEAEFNRRIEEWKIERTRRTPSTQANQMPSGVH